MDEMNRELEDAIGRLKTLLSEAQIVLGAISVFSYLSKKEGEDDVVS